MKQITLANKYLHLLYVTATVSEPLDAGLNKMSTRHSGKFSSTGRGSARSEKWNQSERADLSAALVLAGWSYSRRMNKRIRFTNAEFGG